MAKVRRPKKRMVVLLVSVIAGLSYFFLDSYEEQLPSIQSPKHGDEEADYYGSNITFKQFDASGRLQQSLTSLNSEHFPQIGLSKFMQPMAQATNNEGEIWQIESDTGEIKDSENLVTFIDNVIVQPLNPKPGQNLRIETQRLDYQTQEQLATTNLAVKITGDHTIITGTGMSFWVPNETLKLQQQVNTLYVPPSKP